MRVKLSDIQKNNKAISVYSQEWICPECGLSSFKCSYSKIKTNGIKRVRLCNCGVAFDTFESIKSIRRNN